MNLDGVINSEIKKYIVEKCMIREYKNPKDAQTVRVCGDMLEQLYANLINGGCTKREITAEMMAKIIGDLRRLEQIMK